MATRIKFTCLIVAIAAAFPLFVNGGKRDRDVQAGQVPLKDSPVTFLNNVSIDALDLSKMKGCRGTNCKSAIEEHNWYEEEGSDEFESCEYPKEYGECNGRQKRYFFNEETGSCHRFWYSGCGGNSNNFASRRRCESECNSFDIDEEGHGGDSSNEDRRAYRHRQRAQRRPHRRTRKYGSE